MIPNHIQTVERLAAQYPAEWAAAHTGGPQTEAFIRRLASVLHAIDPRFGLNGKRGNPNDISDDVVCFDGEASGGDYDPTRNNVPVTVIDVIGGAGGPNPVATWNHPLKPSAAAWVKPGPVSGGVVTPVEPSKPVKKPYPGDAYFIDAIGTPLELDYMISGQRLNAGAATWFARAIWDHVNEGLTIEASVAKHRAEWRAALGLPRE